MLFVDDDQDVLELLRIACKYKGIKATLAYSTSDALSKLQGGNYCALVTDLLMSDMNGSDLAMAAKQIKPSLPVFCYTGSGQNDIAKRELFAGIFEKPDDILGVLEKINHHLDHAVVHPSPQA